MLLDASIELTMTFKNFNLVCAINISKYDRRWHLKNLCCAFRIRIKPIKPSQYLVCVVDVVSVDEMLHDEVEQAERRDQRTDDAVGGRQREDQQHPGTDFK